MLYSGMDEEKVTQKAVKLQENIRNLDIRHEYSKTSSFVTISQGICYSVPSQGNKSWDFLHVADEYLYKMKRNKRNGIYVGNNKRRVAYSLKSKVKYPCHNSKIIVEL